MITRVGVADIIQTYRLSYRLQTSVNRRTGNNRTSKMPLCGGAKEPEAATEEIQAICDQVKAEVEQQAGVTYDTFRATTFSSQVVAGTNYFIKVDVGSEKFVHLRVFKGLPHAPELKVSALQLDKGKEDAIGYF